MGPALPTVSDRSRRLRLLHRHRLVAAARATTVTEVADAMVGLHATTPSTVYLSAWARMDGLDPAAMTAALIEDRSLVKQLAMRRTLFVMTRPVLADAVGAVGARVAKGERTNMLRDLRRDPTVADPEATLDALAAAIIGELACHDPLSTADLRRRLADDDIVVTYGEGRWQAQTPLIPRVVNMLSAAGTVMRGPSDADWHRSKPRWALTADWLGTDLAPPEPEAAHRAMVDRWLRTFGPGTETDLVWWLGSTKGAVRASLAGLDVAEVRLDSGETGYVHADDLTDDLPPGAADADPEALLLPELDPTTMGHKQRDFYLGEHAAHVFDRNGNGGQTAWWDGRIVGGWFRRDDGSVGVHLLEALPRHAVRALDARADDLAGWLGEVRPTTGYPAPFMRVVTK